MTSSFRIPALLALALLVLTGCYQRVVSERPFAGMSARRHDTPTAPDYSQAQANFDQAVKERNAKPFDPLGDWIIKPIGGAFKGIGDMFSSDEPKPAATGNTPKTSAGVPSQGGTTSGAAPSSPPPAKSDPSPFDTTP